MSVSRPGHLTQPYNATTVPQGAAARRIYLPTRTVYLMNTDATATILNTTSSRYATPTTIPRSTIRSDIANASQQPTLYRPIHLNTWKMPVHTLHEVII